MEEKRDIVIRLRDYDNCNDGDVDEAADVIEALRREIKDCNDEIDYLRDEIDAKKRSDRLAGR